MSHWKFREFETEVDLTDADFLERLDEAQKQLDENVKSVPIVGKHSDIIRKQVECFAEFFDTIFGEGASRKMYEGKCSLELAMRSAAEFSEFANSEDKRIATYYEKYSVNTHSNREQRRNYGKQQYKGGNKR